jgi:hypothetical protein
MRNAAVIAVDTGRTEPPELEHALRPLREAAVLPAGTVVCSHILRGDGRGTGNRYALTFAFGGEPGEEVAAAITAALPDRGHVLLADGGISPAGDGLAPVAKDALARCAGRAVLYPGIGLLTGDVPVRTVLRETAIDEIAVLDGPLPEDGVLRTRDFVRPQWRAGRLVLAACTAEPGVVAPFEIPDPHHCCGSNH